MFIAKAKRKENIAEYVLYIWQLKDMFRALQFNNEMLWAKIVEPQQQLTPEQKEQAYYWYVDLINLLKSEGKGSSGHIEHTLHLISDLNDLHLQLLKLPAGASYAARFAKTAPEIAKLRSVITDKGISDIELCFRALYSVVLLRLRGDDEGANHVNDVIEVISPLIAHLVSIYHAIEKGEFDLYKED